MDMIVADLERANSRVATVERRNELLRAEIESIRSGSATNDKVKALESQVSDLESESSRLLRALESQKAEAEQAEVTFKKKVDEATKEIQTKTAEIDNLKHKMKKYSDYDEIKRELDIMKYVEFSGGDDQEENEAGYDVHLPNPNADKAPRNQGQSLENLLMAKNKRILDELTKFRILHGELEASLQAATQSLNQNQAELEKQRALNEKLENDLLQINGPSRKATGDRQSEATAPNGLGLNTEGSTPDLLSSLNGLKSEPGVRSSPVPFAATPDTSILPIVTSQRDRFRQRNAELEEELRKQFDIISELRTEIKSLQADNMKLYEKVRYMQSYRDGASSSTFTSTSAAPISSGRDDMGKYQNLYEASMNPFEAFRGREAARAVQSLNPLERGVFVLTRQILGNRRARTAFIVYAVILHLLVMFTTYECATSSSTPPHVSRPMA
ncbi:hypothetical protein FRC02_006691 [Tulasnella sp. 418]|nr:hypothetical protein FRC02_006691 [Tulasnella sp. 418]